MKKIRPPRKLTTEIEKHQARRIGARKAMFLGRPDGVVRARDSYVYVTDALGNTQEVFNRVIPVNKFGFGVPVWIIKSPGGKWEIEKLKNVYDELIDPGIMEHAATAHGANGYDPDWVWQDVFMPWLVIPVGKTVKIYRQPSYTVSTWMDGSVEIVDLTSHIPASGALYVLLEIQTDGTVLVTDGSPAPSPEALLITDIPQLTIGYKPLCAVRLYAFMPEIKKNTKDFYDLRFGRVLGSAEEFLIRVKNISGATINKGTVVYPNGVSGDETTIGIADARYREKCLLYGMVKEDIPNGQIGYVVRLGQVHDINTSGLTGGIVYLKDDGSGWVTNDITTLDVDSFASVVGAVKAVDAVHGHIIVDVAPADTTIETVQASGFPDSAVANSTLAINNTTRVFTIAPISGEFHYYFDGIKYVVSTPQTVTFPDTEGGHIFYFDGDMLGTAVNPTDAELNTIYLNNTIVATTYWDAANNVNLGIGDLRFGIGMSRATRISWKRVFGSQWLYGFELNSILADASGDSNTHAQFGIDLGSTLMQDMFRNSSAITSTTGLIIGALSGASISLRAYSQPGYSVLTDVTAGIGATGRAVYNQFTGGAWQLTVVPSGSYFLCHVFATGINTAQKCVSFMGQSVYGNISDARAGAQTEMANILALINGEDALKLFNFVPIATVIFQTATSYANAVKSRIRTTDTGANFVDWRSSPLLGSGGVGVPEAPYDGLTYNRKNAAWILGDQIGYTTTAGAGPTTLTTLSNITQVFTTSQTVVLPIVTTLTLGKRYEIHNHSAGVITVNSSGGNLVQAMAAGTVIRLTCEKIAADTTALPWDVEYYAQPTEYVGTGTGPFVRATSPTIVTPTIASFANANHTHTATASTGGPIDPATTSVPGSMSAADKTKLDGITASADEVVAETNAANVFSVATSPGGTSAWTGVIESIAGDRLSLVYKAAGTTGTAAAMVPQVTDNLAKIRLYNTTNAPVDYALIFNCVVGTRTITLTGAAPPSWAINENISIVSQTVIGGTFAWMDLEFSPAINKTAMFFFSFVSSTVVGDFMRFHPFTTYSATKVIATSALVAGANTFFTLLLPLISNCFAFSWTGTPISVTVREMGYIT